MSFASGFRTVPYEKLIGNCEEGRESREGWGDRSPYQNDSQKRRKSTSVTARKRAKMTRGDDKIIDETAKQAAKNLLDQIQDTPGQISMNSSKSDEVCPLPSDLSVNVSSKWTISQLREGQLATLLAENITDFKPLDIQKIQKGVVETQILPRQMNLKDTIENLRNENKESDQYVGFAISIANVLRRCDPETAKKLASSITETVEKEASEVINRQSY